MTLLLEDGYLTIPGNILRYRFSSHAGDFKWIVSRLHILGGRHGKCKGLGFMGSKIQRNIIGIDPAAGGG